MKKDKLKDSMNWSTSIPAKQQDSKPAKQQTIKATYYLNPETIKKLKYLSVELNRDYSNLVNEAIEDLIKKYMESK